MQSKAEIYPEPDGTFAFDNGRVIKICKTRDDVGAELEEMIWPLIAPALKAKKPITITITIQYGTD